MRVEVEGLHKRFGAVHALRDVGFDVASGQRVGLIGPNGSGKSTLNRVLLGLLAFEGVVRLDGVAPDDPAAARARAYVPQLPPAFAVPVGELVRALCGLRGVAVAEVEKLCSRLGLPLDGLEGRPFRSLSGGMKQKLLIALALASRASLLILDEPTGSLDAHSRERFFPLFDELPRDTTVLLCSHRLEEVRQLVDRVLLLDDGRCVYDGPAAEFLDATTTSILEVHAGDARADAWLAEQGFRRGTGRWWLRSVGPAEKLDLVRRLPDALGEGLLDLNVRDLEALELEGGRDV